MRFFFGGGDTPSDSSRCGRDFTLVGDAMAMGYPTSSICRCLEGSGALSVVLDSSLAAEKVAW